MHVSILVNSVPSVTVGEIVVVVVIVVLSGRILLFVFCRTLLAWGTMVTASTNKRLSCGRARFGDDRVQ